MDDDETLSSHFQSIKLASPIAQQNLRPNLTRQNAFGKSNAAPGPGGAGMASSSHPHHHHHLQPQSHATTKSLSENLNYAHFYPSSPPKMTNSSSTSHAAVHHHHDSSSKPPKISQQHHHRLLAKLTSKQGRTYAEFKLTF